MSVSTPSERRLRGVLEVAQGVLCELDLDAVLERVVEAAREVSGASYAALGVLDRSRTELERFITVGIDEATRGRIGELPRGRGVLGELIDQSGAVAGGGCGCASPIPTAFRLSTRR